MRRLILSLCPRWGGKLFGGICPGEMSHTPCHSAPWLVMPPLRNGSDCSGTRHVFTGRRYEVKGQVWTAKWKHFPLRQQYFINYAAAQSWPTRHHQDDRRRVSDGHPLTTVRFPRAGQWAEGQLHPAPHRPGFPARLGWRPAVRRRLAGSGRTATERRWSRVADSQQASSMAAAGYDRRRHWSTTGRRPRIPWWWRSWQSRSTAADTYNPQHTTHRPEVQQRSVPRLFGSGCRLRIVQRQLTDREAPGGPSPSQVFLLHRPTWGGRRIPRAAEIPASCQTHIAAISSNSHARHTTTEQRETQTQWEQQRTPNW